MPTREEEFIAWWRDGGRALSVLEQHLGSHDFFVGNSYTIADIALYSYTHCADEGGFDLNAYPHLCRWLARVKNQPNHIGIDDHPLAD